MKYIVMEIQQVVDGTVATLINTYDTIRAAEQQFYTILAAASVSELPTHSAIIMNSDGQRIAYKCFKNEDDE